MKIEVRRTIYSDQSTVGIMYLDSEPVAFTLEDKVRDKKIKGKTAIPSGTYKVGLQLADTTLTRKYKAKFPWFKHHLQLLNVPNYESVYIHIGNFPKDTDGCILVANGYSFSHPDSILDSTLAYKALYNRLYDAAKSGELTIKVG